MVSSPVYRGRFGGAEAERLLWRAGFGPRPGEAARLAKKGLRGAVLSLTRPAPEAFVGPAPRDEKGFPLAPIDATGHDHLWWLDRMVRSSRPLVERMTLVWHDWFATSNQGVASQKLMIDQNTLLRRHALGSFRNLLLDVTRDPAMLLWLDGNKNTKARPNENYGRELMELFTLGADRGYSESDVREQARALTGWRGQVKMKQVIRDFVFDEHFHDGGQKTIFGKSGLFDWQDACRLCLENPAHARFFVRKLWSYFVPAAPDAATEAALVRAYLASSYEVRPLLEAILSHPALYTGPRMVKPPVVYAAGLLRARGRGVATSVWWKLGVASGQRLFYPPNVAGWDDGRWLDTSTFRARWLIAETAQGDDAAQAGPRDPAALVDRAAAYWGGPTLTATTRATLTSFARTQLRKSPPAAVETALRQLVATSPDLQTA